MRIEPDRDAAEGKLGRIKRVRRIRGFDLEIVENFSGWVWWKRREMEGKRGRRERMGWTVAVNESAQTASHLHAHASFTCRTWILFQLSRDMFVSTSYTYIRVFRIYLHVKMVVLRGLSMKPR
jgi:hypothetical protein